jgi:hypothetical protein
MSHVLYIVASAEPATVFKIAVVEFRNEILRHLAYTAYCSCQNPYDMAYILDLRSNGLELRYDPKSQRLCLIKVYDLSKLELSYVSEDRLVRYAKDVSN